MNELLKERKACPLCRSVKLRSVLYVPGQEVIRKKNYHLDAEEENWLEGFVFEIYYCSSCDFYFHRFIPTEELSDKIYSRWIDPCKSLEKIKTNPGNFLYFLSYLIRILNYYKTIGRKIDEITILEIGSGWGKFLELAEIIGFKAFGIEYTNAKLEFMKRKNLRVYGPDAIPPNIRADIVAMSQVLEHISYPLQFLESYLKYLRPEGFLIVETPNCTRLTLRYRMVNFLNLNRNLFGAYQPLEHVNCFTYRSLTGTLGRYGFKPFKMGNVLNTRIGDFSFDFRLKEKLKALIRRPTCLVLKR